MRNITVRSVSQNKQTQGKLGLCQAVTKAIGEQCWNWATVTIEEKVYCKIHAVKRDRDAAR